MRASVRTVRPADRWCAEKIAGASGRRLVRKFGMENDGDFGLCASGSWLVSQNCGFELYLLMEMADRMQRARDGYLRTGKHGEGGVILASECQRPNGLDS